MKNVAKLLIGVLLASNFIACTSQPSGKSPKLTTSMDSVSYAIGVYYAKGLTNFPDKDQIDLKLVKKAMMDVLAGNDSVISQHDLQDVLRKFSMEQQQKQAEVDKKDDADRIKEGQEFLENNKKKPGVVVTPSGLQYTVIKEGSGRTPNDSDIVKVNYKGYTIDGKVFDSSYDRGQPMQFQVNRVIKGWTEGLQLMKEGSVYKFFIPADLAYGNRNVSDKIKSNSTLIFEVELLEIVNPNAAEGK